MDQAPRISYVCTVSGYNQPELEACLQHSPAEVILIVSDSMASEAGPKHLQQLLESRLPATQITRLTGTATAPFRGDDLCQNQHWIRQVLLPVLEARTAAGHQCWLNFTGGTKTLSTALLFAFPWQRCEYKANHSPHLLQYRIIAGPEGRPMFEETTRLPLGSIPPLDIARLHNAACHLRSLNALQTAQPALSSTLARELYMGLMQQDATLLQLFALLEQLWSKSVPAALNQAQLDLPWSTLQATLPALSLSPATLLPWLTRLGALAPQQVAANPLHLRLPGIQADKDGRKWKHWISGDWLEQYLAETLIARGMPPTAMARNLVASDGSAPGSPAGREADLLINWRGQTLLVEIKADVPLNQRTIDLEKQISSLGDRFGNTRKVLFAGPQLAHKLALHADEHQRLLARCHASRITLISDIDKLLQQFPPV